MHVYTKKAVTYTKNYLEIYKYNIIIYCTKYAQVPT